MSPWWNISATMVGSTQRILRSVTFSISATFAVGVFILQSKGMRSVR